MYFVKYARIIVSEYLGLVGNCLSSRLLLKGTDGCLCIVKFFEVRVDKL